MKKFYSVLIALVSTAFIVKAQIIPNICMVTVDDSSKHNIVYYDKSQFSTLDSVILWREDNYMLGSYNRVMANDSNTLSMFLDMDTAGNPNIKLHRYKLQVWRNVGGYSQLGPYHTALFCLQNVTNYNWNFYDVEGTGSGQVNKYMLLQDDNSTNAWHPIDSLSNTTSAAVAPNVSSFPNGQWRLATKWSLSCTPSAREGNNTIQTTIIKSKSNITNNKQSGINQLKSASIVLFPNPATEQVTVRMNFPVSEMTHVKIFNSLGVEITGAELATGKDELVIPVNNLAKGFYFAEISNAKNKITKRLVVN